MDRRGFLTCGAGAVAAATVGCATTGGVSQAEGRRHCPFRLGVAGITLVDFKFDAALAELKKWDVEWFCAKSFHFPLDASEAELKALVRKASDFGVKLYGAGPIWLQSPDEVRKAFDYCAILGVPTLVGLPGALKHPELGAWKGLVPDRKLCEFTSEKADEYGINVAIHNHGRNPQTGNPNFYPAVPETAEIIHDLSPRMGFCVDIAYTFADGLDPVEIIERYGDRIYDVHLRNVAVPTNGSSGAPADAGMIDYVRIFRALKAVGYSGVCGLELQNAYCKPDAVNPRADPSWIPRSLGYFRGLMDVI